MPNTYAIPRGITKDALVLSCVLGVPLEEAWELLYGDSLPEAETK